VGSRLDVCGVFEPARRHRLRCRPVRNRLVSQHPGPVSRRLGRSGSQPTALGSVHRVPERAPAADGRRCPPTIGFFTRSPGRISRSMDCRHGRPSWHGSSSAFFAPPTTSSRISLLACASDTATSPKHSLQLGHAQAGLRRAGNFLNRHVGADSSASHADAGPVKAYTEVLSWPRPGPQTLWPATWARLRAKWPG